MELSILELLKEYVKNLLIQKFKIANVKHSLEYAITYNIFFEYVQYSQGVYANYLYNIIEKKIKAKQKKKKFYAVLAKLEKNNIITKQKKDGLVFLEPHTTHITNIFNLIKKMQNSNSKYYKFLEQYKEAYEPKPREFRNLALLEFKDKKMLDIMDREKLKMLFYEYLNKIDDNYIVLYHKQKQKLIKIKYQTRFNSESRLYEKIDLFFELFENAKEKYKDAVFLTLTLNPQNFKNIYDASKEVSKALNRFLSYLKKFTGKKRISYINVFEFQKNGLIHLHIVLFGFKWLMPQKKLSKLWAKYGMGKIVYLYRLKLDSEGFKFDKNKPKDTKDDFIDLYLVKYLKKAFYDKSELSLYWLTNKRFYTYSRDLKEKKEDKKEKVGYDFVGVFNKKIFEELGDDDFIATYIETYNRIKNYWSSWSLGYG